MPVCCTKNSFNQFPLYIFRQLQRPQSEQPPSCRVLTHKNSGLRRHDWDLGHAVRRSSTSRGGTPLITLVFLPFFVPSVSRSSFRVTQKAQITSRVRFVRPQTAW